MLCGLGDVWIFTRSLMFPVVQFSFVYPYPNVSDFAGRPRSEQNSDKNSDHPTVFTRFTRERRDSDQWSEFLGRENSDHGQSFGCFWVGGRQWRSQLCLGNVRIEGVCGTKVPRTCRQRQEVGLWQVVVHHQSEHLPFKVKGDGTHI